MKTVKFSRVVVVGLIVLLCAGCGQEYSEGSRAGVVTKLSKKGIIWKSWEGELLMALPSDTGITTPEKFRFSTRDDKVAAEVQKALKEGKRIEMTYDEWFIPPLTIDSSHVVTGIK